MWRLGSWQDAAQAGLALDFSTPAMPGHLDPMLSGLSRALRLEDEATSARSSLAKGTSNKAKTKSLPVIQQNNPLGALYEVVCSIVSYCFEPLYSAPRGQLPDFVHTIGQNLDTADTLQA